MLITCPITWPFSGYEFSWKMGEGSLWWSVFRAVFGVYSPTIQGDQSYNFVLKKTVIIYLYSPDWTPNMGIKTMAPNYIPWGKPMGEFTNSASDLWKSTDQHRSSQLRGVAHQRFRFQSGRSKHLDQAGTHFSRGSLGKLAEAGSKLKANGSLKASSLVWDVRMGHEWDRIKIANQHQPT